MSFDLRIYFTGLCLFAPDPVARRMHVLLPAFGSGDHLHRACLVYDVAYLIGAANLARRLDCVPMEGKFAELLLGGVLNSALPREVVNLDTIIGEEKLHRSYISNDPGPFINSRITLSSGIVSDYEVGAHFTVGGMGARRMTWQLEWTIRGINADRLTLAFKPFGVLEESETPPPLPRELFPVGETIRLFVYNATCTDLPPRNATTVTMPADRRVLHFDGFYRLYATGPGKPLPEVAGFQPEEVDCGCPRPPSGAGGSSSDTEGCESSNKGDLLPTHAPVVVSEPPVINPATFMAVGQGGVGGRPFTCMVAQATLAPPEA